MPNNLQSEDTTIRSKSGYSEGVSSSSWTVASDSAVLKKIDKTVFADHGTRIPKNFRNFFNVGSLQPGDKRTLYLWNQKRRYEATIKMTILDFPRTQLSWKKDFSGVLQTTFPNWLTFFSGDSVEPEQIPSLKFVKRSLPWEYDVEFIDDENMEHTVQIHDKLVLTKYQEYSRNDAQKIFDPNSHFTPKSGKWGLRGIITHPTNDKDFIFFVTFGHTQSGYSFDESITKNGIFSWQSEPKQKLTAPIIKKLIAHDATKNNIHLFLRTQATRDYTYLGQLAYIDHDPKRQQPVHFTWQILDWDLGADKAKEMGLELQPDGPVLLKNSDNTTTFIQTLPPNLKPIVRELKPRTFVGRKNDHAARNQKNTDIGDAGEIAAIEIEKAILRCVWC